MRVRTLCAITLLAALTAVVAATLRAGGDLGRPAALLYWYAAAWVLFACAVWVVRRMPVRTSVALILAGGIALCSVALSAPPRTSDDMYRYAWDGRVQAAGVSPYAHPPDAPQLARLRDPWLFPATSACHGWDLRSVRGVCTRINRPSERTIYPPVAEGWFLLVHAVSPAGGRHKPLQIAGAVLAVATTVALLLVQRRRGGDTWWVALWAWCPAVPFAAVNDAHVDTLGVLLTVAALGTAAGARRGALLGAAIAVKLLPALTVPGALSGVLAPGRHPRARLRETASVLLAAGGVVALVYLPHLLASGSAVLGYLPGYLREEGYEPGDVGRFALLRLVLPDAWAGPAAVALVALSAWYVLRRGDPKRPWHGSLLVTGTALLLTSPAYYWYALLVVALVAMGGRWEWLAVAAAGTVLYVAGAREWHGVQATAYGLAAATVLVGALVRTRQRGGGLSATPDARGSSVAAAEDDHP
ncbi:glycosyltransferase 87 family protein [Streptomyces sp. RY43-2]|uniref:Glycosyltransferase 87 family protein n=1 Tax=Streptomyces macrolidinus TaxID=2952607 RepID=A0ABT0ZC94_9ACTN|nr:glycosyltransferase 87 family protein [Streptomyces macrolidinus]MCN9241077.1 glycosyltransferase 87 family protein [Streptomyces macrolidinus]